MYLGSKAIPMISALALGASTLGALADTDVKFALDWRFEGPAAGFLLAEDLGYFAEEGLNVTIDTGTGSVNTIPRVASGLYDMGFGDLNSLVKFLDEDPAQPVIGVGMVYDKPTFGIVGRKSLGITEDPKSVEGRKLGAPPPDAPGRNGRSSRMWRVSTTARSPSNPSASRCASRCWPMATSTASSALPSRSS